MKASIARRLVDLNRAFYEGFGDEFSRTRKVLQPGIPRSLGLLGEFGSLLDVGCGDARIGIALAGGRLPGRLSSWKGSYVGVDFSQALLRGLHPGEGNDGLLEDFRLCRADLAEPGWTEVVRRQRPRFDAAVVFSVLHHIPSHDRRLGLLNDLGALLQNRGRCVVSVWQILHLERFRKKVVSFAELELSQSEVEDGDLLIDWRQGGRGLRYVHHFTLDELGGLCKEAGFRVVDQFRSDGRTGDLGVYLLIEKTSP